MSRIDASGVFSSWVTVDTKSDCIAASAAAARTARAVATRPIDRRHGGNRDEQERPSGTLCDIVQRPLPAGRHSRRPIRHRRTRRRQRRHQVGIEERQRKPPLANHVAAPAHAITGDDRPSSLTISSAISSASPPMRATWRTIGWK